MGYSPWGCKELDDWATKHTTMSGRIIPVIWGKEQRFLQIRPPPTFWPFMISLRTVMASVTVSLAYANVLCQRTDVFDLWHWRRLLRIPWTARRLHQSTLKEIDSIPYTVWQEIHWAQSCSHFCLGNLAVWNLWLISPQQKWELGNWLVYNKGAIGMMLSGD